MSGDDYLWDGSGEPDPEVQRLEKLLRPLRSDRPAPEPVPMGGADPGPGRGLRPGASAGWMTSHVWRGLATAAVLLVAVAATWNWTRTSHDGWFLQHVEGVSWSDARVVSESRLAVGTSLDTRTGRVRLSVGRIGEVQLEPATLVTLVDDGRAIHRLALERGTLHALIWAPPGHFVVDTPSATAVDLGCSYTLQIDEDGSGVLRVEAGWVGFEHRGLRSLVPAGAEASVRRGRGPGTPRFSDASPAFASALRAVDFGETPTSKAAALDVVLAEARPRDALSLWHLLARTEGLSRERVFDRLAALVPPPAGVTRDGVFAGHREPIDAWWNALDLGSADGWREWTTPYREPTR